MRAQEFICEDEKKTRFADGYLVFSDHFEDRLRERNIPKSVVLQLLDQLERRRSVDLIRMPFITFVVKSHNLALAFSKQLDKSRNTAYVVATARNDLRSGEDEDVIYLEEDSATADQVLQYVKRAHAPDRFDIEYSITDHPRWELKNIPVSQLKLDPEGEHQDPYNRVNWVDYDKVQELMPQIASVLKTMPIVVDSQGWIIDGNHRATAAAEAGLKSVPAYVPAKQNVAEAFNQPYPMTWEHGDESHDALVKLPDGTNLSIMFSMDYGAYGDEEWTVEFWRNNSQEVTGEGDQQRIFATVLSAIQQFIKTEHPERIRFSANKDVEPGQKSQTRSNLYTKLVQRYANSWGYVVDVDDFADTTVYNLHTLTENFADGKVRGKSRPGRVKRAGASCKGSVTDLRAKARKYGGERGKMYHWCANMKGGKKK